MRTRSGGKPPVTSYALMGSEDNEKSERGKRGRGSLNKGGGRGRRTGGRYNYNLNFFILLISFIKLGFFLIVLLKKIFN